MRNLKNCFIFFKKKASLVLLMIGYFLLLPAAAWAIDYQIEVPLPGAPETFSNPAQYFQYFFIFSLALIGFLAVGALVAGGMMWMLGGSISSVEKAKNIIVGGLSGLILLLASYLLLYTIDPKLTDLTLQALEKINIIAIPPHEGLSFTKQQIQSSSLAQGQYADLINKYARQYGLPPSLVKAIIMAESGGNPNAVSPVGAKGLMQLMPQYHPLSNYFDPEANIAAGTKFLGELYQMYNGNTDQVIAAYNWGPGNLNKNCGSGPNNCSRLPQETKIYLERVNQYYYDFI